jgi:hypothetical protein
VAKGLPPATARAAAVAIAVIAIPATFVLGARQGTDLATGPLTIGAHDPVDMATPHQMSRFIIRTTGKRPPQLTLLSGGKDPVLVTQPYNGFLALSARYAHPEAQLPRRVRWVQKAAECSNAACTTRLLTQTPFGRVDALVLSRVRVGFQLQTQTDSFPLPRLVTIDFPRAHLDPLVWAHRRFGQFTVFARRPVPVASATGLSSPAVRAHRLPCRKRYKRAAVRRRHCG